MAERSISRTALARSIGSLRISVPFRRLAHFWQVIRCGIVFEFCPLSIEIKNDCSNWPMSLFGDYYFCLTIHLTEAGLPLFVIVLIFFLGLFILCVVVALPRPMRFLARIIILLAKDKHHDVGVLFDRSRFSQISEQGTLVL